MVDVVVLGWDAFDSLIAKKFIVQGRLKHMRREIEDGNLSFQPIDTYYTDNLSRAFTGQAWPSIYVGGGAEVHGIKKGGKFNAWPNYALDVPAGIYDDVSHADLRMASFRMPVTYAARPVNGWQVAGFPSGEDGGVNEKEVAGELGPDDLPDEYPDLREYDVQHSKEEVTQVPEWIKADNARFDMFLDLLEEHGGYDSYDVVFYGTNTPDKLGHYWGISLSFSEGEDATFDDSIASRAPYSTMDEQFNRIIEELDPELIIGISDHGFSLTDNVHSDRATIFEWSADGDPHDFDDFEDIRDFRDYFTERLGIEQADRIWKATEQNDEEYELSDEEEDEIRGNLEDMGYL